MLTEASLFKTAGHILNIQEATILHFTR